MGRVSLVCSCRRAAIVPPNQIQFDNGAGYERYMGVWSQLAGRTFLDWLAPPSGVRWLDVGCGTGAFTELVLDRCAPSGITGVDPSEAQLVYARARLSSRGAQFELGDAVALPFDDGAFQVAVMPLVIFFVPDPAKGVAEMARVVGRGGTVAAYAWDMDGGGFPYAMLREELRELGFHPPEPPRSDASRFDRLLELWAAAGLGDVATREIVVRRAFAGFDDYWETIAYAPSTGKQLADLSPATRTELRRRLTARMPSPDTSGRITLSARANAVRGTGVKRPD